MMYFFAGAGFHWESITGWNFVSSSDNSPASLKIQFRDRLVIGYEGKEAEQLNEFLKSKSIVLNFEEQASDDELKRIVIASEQIVDRLTRIVEPLEAAQSSKLGSSGGETAPA